MNILIVGAGAVGQVYGWHLRQAGHDVTFYVKAKYQADVSRGLTLHRLSYSTSHQLDWSAPAAISTLTQAAQQTWDQVWLTVSSDALRSRNIADLLSVIGKATIICLQPDLDDVNFVRTHVQSVRQVVQGLITFISYQSPLLDRRGPDGIAYYVPPLSKGIYGGDSSRLKAVIAALNQGGLKARAVPDFAKATAAAPALMQPLIAALELNDWQLDGFTKTPDFKLGIKAAKEALNIAQRHSRSGRTPLSLLLHGSLWRSLLPLAERVMPLPLEPYLRYHFTKVGQQTRLMLDTYIRLGTNQGVSTAQLKVVRERLGS